MHALARRHHRLRARIGKAPHAIDPRSGGVHHQALVKQREDSIFQFRKANRPELVQKEQKELDVLKAYLPEEASEAEIEAAVEKAIAQTGAASAKDIGKAMKAALAELLKGGKPADGKKVNDAVRRRLGA